MDSPWRHSWNTNGPVPTAFVCALLATSVLSLSSMLTTWNMSKTVGHGCGDCRTTVYLSLAVKVESGAKKPVTIPTVTFGFRARVRFHTTSSAVNSRPQPWPTVFDMFHV